MGIRSRKVKKSVIIIAMICASIVAGIIAILQNQKAKNTMVNVDPELMRARNYAQFVDGDDAVYMIRKVED